jgi:hypothetical protein
MRWGSSWIRRSGDLADRADGPVRRPQGEGMPQPSAADACRSRLRGWWVGAAIAASGSAAVWIRVPALFHYRGESAAVVDARQARLIEDAENLLRAVATDTQPPGQGSARQGSGEKPEPLPASRVIAPDRVAPILPLDAEAPDRAPWTELPYVEFRWIWNTTLCSSATGRAAYEYRVHWVTLGGLQGLILLLAIACGTWLSRSVPGRASLS